MFRSTLIVTLLSLATLVLSFAGQLVLAACFGASAETDAYFVATTLPMLIVNLLASVASTALVPIFIELRVKKDETAAWRLASALNLLLLFGLLLLAVAGGIFAERVIRMTAPGLLGDQLVLATRLLRWSLPVLLLMAFSQIAIGLHHVDGRFAIPALSMILPPLGMVFGGIAFNRSLGIYALVVGQLLGALGQVWVLVWHVVGPRRLWWLVNARVSGLGTAVGMVLPLLLGGTLYLLMPVIERFFASGLPVGTITHLSIASRLGNLAPPLLASGLATTSFPRIAKQMAHGDRNGALTTLSLALRLFVIAGIPVVVLSPLYALPLTRLLFERGAFTAVDSAAVAGYVPLYLAALTAGACGSVIARGFYGLLQDTRTISINSAAHLGVYVILCAGLTPALGALGLAMAQAVFWVSGVGVATLLLRWRLHGRGGRTIAQTIARCAVAALLTYGIVWLMLQVSAILWVQALGVAIGFGIYGVLGWKVFREPGIEFVLQRLRQVVARREAPESG